MSSVLKETRKGNISFLKSGQRHRKVCSVVAEASNSETNSFFTSRETVLTRTNERCFDKRQWLGLNCCLWPFFAISGFEWTLNHRNLEVRSSRFSSVRSFDVFGDNFKNRNSCHRSIFFLLGLIFLRREWLSLRREWLWSYNLNSFFCPVQFDRSFLFVFGIGSSRKIICCIISCWTVACQVPFWQNILQKMAALIQFVSWKCNFSAFKMSVKTVPKESLSNG